MRGTSCQGSARVSRKLKVKRSRSQSIALRTTSTSCPSLKGATGRFLGEVAAVNGGTISFKTRDRLHVGDRLRVQPKSDQAGTAFTVKELQLGRRPAKLAPAGTLVSVPSPFRGQFRVGDAVFKVSSEQAFTMSDAACRRRLETASYNFV